MTRRLRREIHQKKPFAAIEEEVYLEMLTAAHVTGRIVAGALKATGLSSSQFNVLRILRGALPGALASSRIAERMVNHDPDLTRLLDRLEASGLVEKARDDADRRVLRARITPRGLEVVERASQSVTRAIVAALRPLGTAKLEALADLLELARDAARRSEQVFDSASTPPHHQGDRHGKRQESDSRHGSHRPAGRRGRAGAAGQGSQSARDDAQARRRRGA